jgi:uncharacterized membrane protein YqjE
MSMLWSLPKAAPVLLRHLAAYVELAALDLAKAQREISTQLLASAIVAVSILFALLMGCLAVVAATWNTPYRLIAIAWMGGAFVVLAVGAAMYKSRIARLQTPILDSVRREWHADRMILERILASEREQEQEQE